MHLKKSEYRLLRCAQTSSNRFWQVQSCSNRFRRIQRSWINANFLYQQRDQIRRTLKRLLGENIFKDLSIWQNFEPTLMTLVCHWEQIHRTKWQCLKVFLNQVLIQPLSGHTDSVLRNVLNRSRFAFWFKREPEAKTWVP